MRRNRKRNTRGQKMEHSAQPFRPKHDEKANKSDVGAREMRTPEVRWGVPQRAPRKLPTEAEKLCSEFFNESIAFAEKFAALAGIPHENAPTIQGTIVRQCSELIESARVSALEATRP